MEALGVSLADKSKPMDAYSPRRKPDMAAMTKTELKNVILELCAEDYYGVWEIYWNYQGLMETNGIDVEFLISVLDELVAANKIVPYDKNEYTNEFERATLDLERLRAELGEVMIGNIPKSLYWFGCP